MTEEPIRTIAYRNEPIFGVLSKTEPFVQADRRTTNGETCLGAIGPKTDLSSNTVVLDNPNDVVFFEKKEIVRVSPYSSTHKRSGSLVVTKIDRHAGAITFDARIDAAIPAVAHGDLLVSAGARVSAEAPDPDGFVPIWCGCGRILNASAFVTPDGLRCGCGSFLCRAGRWNGATYEWALDTRPAPTTFQTEHNHSEFTTSSSCRGCLPPYHHGRCAGPSVGFHACRCAMCLHERGLGPRPPSPLGAVRLATSRDGIDCQAEHPTHGYLCSAPNGHEGDHVATHAHTERTTAWPQEKAKAVVHCPLSSSTDLTAEEIMVAGFRATLESKPPAPNARAINKPTKRDPYLDHKLYLLAPEMPYDDDSWPRATFLARARAAKARADERRAREAAEHAEAMLAEHGEPGALRAEMAECEGCGALAPYESWADARAAGWASQTTAGGAPATSCPECRANDGEPEPQ